MKNFLNTNKVLLAAMVSALIMVGQQALSTHAFQLPALGFAALIAVLGVIGNQWKGKGLSITGIVGTLAYNFVSIYQTGTFTWNEFIATSLIAFLLVVQSTLQPQPHE